jgi:DNA-binding beta-propeller fold protein YncE
VDPLGYQFFYVANASDQRIDIVGVGHQSPFEVVKSIPMPAKPAGIAMGTLRGLAFVVLANGDVVAISLKTQTIVSTIQAGTSLGGIVVDPYGEQRIYALDTDAVEALDPSATTIRQTFAVPPGALSGSAFATTS